MNLFTLIAKDIRELVADELDEKTLSACFNTLHLSNSYVQRRKNNLFLAFFVNPHGKNNVVFFDVVHRYNIEKMVKNLYCKKTYRQLNYKLTISIMSNPELFGPYGVPPEISRYFYNELNPCVDLYFLKKKNYNLTELSGFIDIS